VTGGDLKNVTIWVSAASGVIRRLPAGPGMVFVDVGANWGYFTLAGAHLVGPTWRTVTLEVDPRALRCSPRSSG
jgi:precorrin-6B methylase 2